jgi:hypothetical protein
MRILVHEPLAVDRPPGPLGRGKLPGHAGDATPDTHLRCALSFSERSWDGEGLVNRAVAWCVDVVTKEHDHDPRCTAVRWIDPAGRLPAGRRRRVEHC